MKIELRKPSEIKPYPGNPRVNDSAVEAVARSLNEFGFRQPIVVDEEGVVIVGHTRLKAAEKLGLAEVPVHVAKGLTAEQIKAYRLADNKTSELSEWDYELLAMELTGLQEMDYDLELLGFSKDELVEIMAPDGTEGLTDPDDIPQPPDEPISKRGDLWVLGNHRLLCGDSADPDDVDRLLDGAKIQLVNTDPPYNVNVEPASNNADTGGQRPGKRPPRNIPSWRSLEGQRLRGIKPKRKTPAPPRKTSAKGRRLMGDFVSDAEFGQRLLAWFGNISRVLEPGRCFYLWGGYANIGNYPPALEASGLYMSQCLIWVKGHPVITRKDYMGDHEWCQPPDTQVMTPSGCASLGSLRDGDRVVSYSRPHGCMIGLRDGLSVQTTSCPYDGSLYGVVVRDRTTWCTGGHLWSVKLRPEYRSMWCVYLMRRGQWWRVGVTKMLTTWGFGLKGRMSSEGGEEGWILSLHSSHSDARIVEQVVSVQFGIPMTCWKESTVAQRRQAAQIERLYEGMDLEELDSSANRALEAHRRERNYPFVQVRNTRPRFGNRHPMLVRGCNLLPGIMEVPLPVQGQQTCWEIVRSVDVQPYVGDVYSMEVERYRHYVADGIVTHNCFYGWREGAGHKYFGPNNATDVWPVKKVNPQAMIHLTEKPVELAARAMNYSSRPGENVLDLFGGSGSTLIAAEQTGRRAFLMELDPLYVDVIVERWQRFTGKQERRESAVAV
jgi:DNA modification methylase